MKKQLLIIMAFALIGLSFNKTFAQCPYTANSYSMGTLNITTTQQTATASNGDYYLMNLMVDDTIIIQAVSIPDMEITIWDSGFNIITSSSVGNLQYIVLSVGTYYVHFSDPTCLEDGSALDNFTYVIQHQTGGGSTGTGTQGNPVGSIAGNYFVQGVSTVTNSITIQSPEPTATTIDFYASDFSHTTIYDSLIGQSISGAWNLDMGSLQPNAIIWVKYYDNTHTYLDSSYAYTPIIIAKPQWLLSIGTVTSVNLTGTTVNMLGHFNLLPQTPTMPDDIPGLKNLPFEILSPDVSFNIDFDCTNGTATANSPNANFNMNVFNQQTFTYSYPISIGATLSFPQPDFNPKITAEGTYNTPPYNLNWPLAKIYPSVKETSSKSCEIGRASCRERVCLYV